MSGTMMLMIALLAAPAALLNRRLREADLRRLAEIEDEMADRQAARRLEQQEGVRFTEGPTARSNAGSGPTVPKPAIVPQPQSLARVPFVVPPQNCRERLRREGKPHPRSSCNACGSLSPMWRQCNAALELEQEADR